MRNIRATSTAAEVQRLLTRFAAGNSEAQRALVERAITRLRALSHRQLGDFPGVARWTQSDDVAQGAAQRLHRALDQLHPETPREFFALCSQQIRRELLDLKRKFYGPQGLGRHHATPGRKIDGSAPLAGPPFQVSNSTYNPERLARWTELHARIDSLPEELREVFDLVWYQELTHNEAGEVLNVSTKTVSRRWREARLRLRDLLAGDEL